ncbi:MAG: hypothetical protein AAF433_06070 [Bacteroidota bacterium]
MTTFFFLVGLVEVTKAQEAPFSASLLDQLEEQFIAGSPAAISQEPSARRLPIRLSLDNYWSAYRADSTTIRRQQSIFSFQTFPKIAGIQLQLGGRLYAEDYQIDAGRSGLSLNFQRADYLNQLQRDPAKSQWVHQAIAEVQQGQLAAAGITEEVQQLTDLDRYLAIINSSTYLAYVEEAKAALIDLAEDTTATAQLEKERWRARLDTVQRFGQAYAEVLTQVQAMPEAVRREVLNQSAALSESLQAPDNPQILQALRQSGRLNGWEQLLLLTKDFSLGQTQLPQDEFASIGLPINGLSYHLEQQSFSVAVQLGKRIRSTHFLPVDGSPFHDRQADQSAMRIELGLGDAYRVSVQRFREQSEGIGSESPLFPRTNTVWSFSGKTPISEKFHFISALSYASTSLSSAGNPAATTVSWTGQLALRLAAAWQTDQLELEVGAFRVGDDYESFGNPYLITDYQGADVRLRTNTADGRWQADFSLALGQSLDRPNTADLNRWQARGQLRYQLGKASYVGLIVAPNIFRQTVNNEDAFSQANIYRLFYQAQPKIADRPLQLFVAVTNLNRGLNWQDSTRNTQSVVLESQLDYLLGERFSMGGSGRKSILQRSADAGPDWAYLLRAQWSGTYHFGLQLRYDRYPFEGRAAWGAAINAQCPLGRFGQLSVFLNYRPSPDLSAAAEQFAHQNLSFNF